MEDELPVPQLPSINDPFDLIGCSELPFPLTVSEDIILKHILRICGADNQMAKRAYDSIICMISKKAADGGFSGACDMERLPWPIRVYKKPAQGENYVPQPYTQQNSSYAIAGDICFFQLSVDIQYTGTPIDFSIMYPPGVFGVDTAICFTNFYYTANQKSQPGYAYAHYDDLVLQLFGDGWPLPFPTPAPNAGFKASGWFWCTTQEVTSGTPAVVSSVVPNTGSTSSISVTVNGSNFIAFGGAGDTEICVNGVPVATQVVSGTVATATLNFSGKPPGNYVITVKNAHAAMSNSVVFTKT